MSKAPPSGPVPSECSCGHLCSPRPWLADGHCSERTLWRRCDVQQLSKKAPLLMTGLILAHTFCGCVTWAK